MKKIFGLLSESKYISPKVLGLIRHGLTVIGTVLIVTKVIPSGTDTTSIIDKIIELTTSTEGIIAELSLIFATVGSWFSKDKKT